MKKYLSGNKLNDALFGAMLAVAVVLCVGAVATVTKYTGTFVGNGAGITNASGFAFSKAVMFNQWNRATNVVLDVAGLTNGSGASALPAKVVQHNQWNRITNAVLDMASLTNANGVPLNVAQGNEAGLITNLTSVATDTNAVANTSGQATNLTVTTSLTVNGLTGNGIQLAVRGVTGQANNIFAVQNGAVDSVFSIATNGAICFNNALTNSTHSTAALFWLVVSNKGLAYTIPLYGLSD